MFIPQNDIAIFRIVQLGLEQPTLVEVLGGLNENEQVITTGASALRDGDRIVIPGQTDGGGRRGRTGGEAAAAQGVQGEGRRNGGEAAASQGLREGRRSGGAGQGCAVALADRGALQQQTRQRPSMSIPRLAIHRPVTMFMISGVVTLLGRSR